MVFWHRSCRQLRRATLAHTMGSRGILLAACLRPSWLGSVFSLGRTCFSVANVALCCRETARVQHPTPRLDFYLLSDNIVEAERTCENRQFIRIVSCRVSPSNATVQHPRSRMSSLLSQGRYRRDRGKQLKILNNARPQARKAFLRRETILRTNAARVAGRRGLMLVSRWYNVSMPFWSICVSGGCSVVMSLSESREILFVSPFLDQFFWHIFFFHPFCDFFEASFFLGGIQS